MALLNKICTTDTNVLNKKKTPTIHFSLFCSKRQILAYSFIYNIFFFCFSFSFKTYLQMSYTHSVFEIVTWRQNVFVVVLNQFEAILVVKWNWKIVDFSIKIHNIKCFVHLFIMSAQIFCAIQMNLFIYIKLRTPYDLRQPGSTINWCRSAVRQTNACDSLHNISRTKFIETTESAAVTTTLPLTDEFNSVPLSVFVTVCDA